MSPAARHLFGDRELHCTGVKPYSEACDRNKEPILQILRQVFGYCHAVLELGSGTGQHAVYLAQQLPHLIWHTSDLLENHAGIRAWLDDAGLENTRLPVLLDVEQEIWPSAEVDGIFSANTAHIMSWPQVEKMFQGVSRTLSKGGVFVLYGPFNYGGNYTSDSNAYFDRWLKQRDPLSAIREFEAVTELAQAQGMVLQQDYEMPANNRCLVWHKEI